MALKRSIKQNLVLKNLDANNVVLGNDGLLYQKEETPAISDTLTSQAFSEELSRNALVFLDNQEQITEIKKETKGSKTRKKKIAE